MYSYINFSFTGNNERFCLICALREQIELSLTSTGKVVSPWKFVDNLSCILQIFSTNYIYFFTSLTLYILYLLLYLWFLTWTLPDFSSSFQRYQQEDAHEFLQCFLDRLESSFTNLKLKDVAFSSQSNNLVKQVFGGRVISKVRIWSTFIPFFHYNFQHPFCSLIFSFYLYNFQLRCCNCNHISDTYEPSVDLSLEIDDANTLSTALESFTKVEHIGDEEMKFTCDNCKEKVSVDKQLMLDQLKLLPSVCFSLKKIQKRRLLCWKNRQYYII